MSIPKISRATLSDAEVLHGLVNTAYRGEDSQQGWASEAHLFEGSRISLAGMKALLSDSAVVVLKYTEDDQVLGCVELRNIGNKLYLGMLSVRPHLQGRGIGKKLMQAAEEEARRQLCIAVFMTVITQREELMQWYVRHGYLDTGIRKPFGKRDPSHGTPKTDIELATLEKQLL